MANQLKKKFIGNDQVDGTKVLFENNQYLRIKKADGTPINLFKLDGTDKFVMSDAPIITNPSTDANGLQTKTQLESAVAAEAALRTAADAAIQTDVDAVETGLAQEITDRQAADTTLQSNITAEESARIAADALLIPLTQKGAANGVASLNGAGKVPVSQLPSAIMEYQGVYNATTNSPALADFADGAAAGDAIGNVYRVSVAGSHDFGSGSISFEVGDYVICNALGKWEKSDTTDSVASVCGKQGIVTLNTSDITENPSFLYFTDARAQAANDARFDLVEADVADHEIRISSLESAIPSWNKIKKALISGDITNGYVDLAHIVVPGSLSAFVDRLAIHEGASEDYTLSTVGGVTRVTFVNSLVSPGSESLSVGDNVYFKYQY